VLDPGQTGELARAGRQVRLVADRVESLLLPPEQSVAVGVGIHEVAYAVAVQVLPDGPGVQGGVVHVRAVRPLVEVRVAVVVPILVEPGRAEAGRVRAGVQPEAELVGGRIPRAGGVVLPAPVRATVEIEVRGNGEVAVSVVGKRRGDAGENDVLAGHVLLPDLRLAAGADGCRGQEGPQPARVRFMLL